ncbi:MAG: hypothetical protein ACYDBX_04550 [Patescibacteria group bacterium]
MKPYFSQCCGSEMSGEDVDYRHCRECGESCMVMETCDTCGGTGEIVDQNKINSQTIDIPYIKCPDCEEGLVEYNG